MTCHSIFQMQQKAFSRATQQEKEVLFQAKAKALSQSRANKVQVDIIVNGAKADQIIEAVGYISAFAKAATTDKVGMPRDRKVAYKVSMQ